MGRFSGIGEVDLFEKGVYLSPEGSYELEVQNMLLKETRKAGLGFIVEFTVVSSTHESHAVGSKATWFQKLIDTDVAFPAIKEFFVSLLDVDMKDPEAKEEFNNSLEDLLDEVTSWTPTADDKDHPLKGTRIRCDTYSKKTKEKNLDFTAHVWQSVKEEAA